MKIPVPGKLPALICSGLVISLLLAARGTSNGVVYDQAKAHHGDGEFISKQKGSFLGHLFMRMREDAPPARDPAQVKAIIAEVDQALVNSYAASPRATWIGHATTLVQYRDVSFLTDPHLTQYPFYYKLYVEPRFTQPALTFAEMPKIDFIVISHNHYDHLDHRTVDMFGNSVLWYVPLGLKAWFIDPGISAERVSSSTGGKATASTTRCWSPLPLANTGPSVLPGIPTKACGAAGRWISTDSRAGLPVTPPITINTSAISASVSVPSAWR